ncbi:hypothetical protein Tsubulata_005045 [Turnera subulata]|uniref:F-box domain-containing protein n=1 Tax=Turnera subulata TaxID=218843 RepID=A0A9Q0J4W2_9ROSI|nr:hypothetical protein Tsubulata_005045 [Turnera subulata]
MKRAREVNPRENFPYDMILEIVSKLPAKSLYRFRCISTSLHSFISSINSTSYPRHKTKLCALLDDRYSHRHHYTHYSVIDAYETTSSMVRVGPASKILTSPSHQPNLSPSHQPHFSRCLTWRCFTSDNSWLVLLNLNPYVLYLLHASTGEAKLLPSHEYLFSSPFHCYSYGTFYDPSLKDYKIVIIDGGPARQGKLTKLGVFSRNANCWEKIVDFPKYRHILVGFALLHGALHWINPQTQVLPDGVHAPRGVILRFDLKEETYIEVPSPPDPFSFPSDSRLDVIRGNICAHYYCDPTFFVWEMKDYMVKQSWTLVCSITNPPVYREWRPLDKKEDGYRALAFTKHEELIFSVDFWDHVKVYIYNPDDGTCKRIMECGGIAPYLDM